MKLKCLNCRNEFEEYISHDEFGWYTNCPECGDRFDVDIPGIKIQMLFTNEIDKENFVDSHLKNSICSYYAFTSLRDFIITWKKIVENPDGMWYWVIDAINGNYICSGACDPYDIEIFEDYFNEKFF